MTVYTGEFTDSNTLGLGVLSTGLMLSSKLIFPYMLDEDVANPAADFFLGYAANGILLLLINNSAQISFQIDEWYVPAISSFLYVVPATVASYLLAFPLNMGALGVGLGGSLSGLFGSIAIQAWLCRKPYAPYRLYEKDFTNLYKNSLSLLKRGGELALQRLTEWGNLFVITSLIGAKDTKSLSAIPPSLQCTMILALSMQGLAQATVMLIKRNIEPQKKAIRLKNQQHYFQLHEDNICILIKNNIFGTLLSAVLVGIIYFQQEAIVDFFLSDQPNAATKDLAISYLNIYMIGLLFESARLIPLGALRSWDDIIKPTFVCLAIMTGIGVTAGYEISSNKDNDWSYMFIARNITIIVSALLMVMRCAHFINVDKKKYPVVATNSPSIPEQVPDRQNKSIFNSFCCFYRRKTVAPAAPISLQNVEIERKNSLSIN